MSHAHVAPRASTARRPRPRLARWLSLALVISCTEQSRYAAPIDAPGNADAGTTPADAGPTPTDAGPTPADAGTTPTDAGTTPADAGPTPTDAGATPADAGTTPADAGTTPADAGPLSGGFEAVQGVFVTAGCGRTRPGGGLATCHSPGNIALVVDLLGPNAFAELVNAPSQQYPASGERLVVPGEADQSLLIKKLTNQLPEDLSLGAPMPLGEGIRWQPLGDEDLAAVRDWINGGARPPAALAAVNRAERTSGTGR